MDEGRGGVGLGGEGGREGMEKEGMREDSRVEKEKGKGMEKERGGGGGGGEERDEGKRGWMCVK